MLEIDDLPTFNILVFPDEADQQLQTDTATVPVDAHEDFDENIALPDFDNLDEALDKFDSIAEKVEAWWEGKSCKRKERYQQVIRKKIPET